MIDVEYKNKNVDYYNYLGVYVRLLHMYKTIKKRFDKLEEIKHDKITQDNLYIFKDCLQNYYKFGYIAYDLLKDEYNATQNKLFGWLDNTNEPYFYIYHQAKENNYKKGVYGVYNIEPTGINEFTHQLAKDYALYEIFKK